MMLIPKIFFSTPTGSLTAIFTIMQFKATFVYFQRAISYRNSTMSQVLEAARGFEETKRKFQHLVDQVNNFIIDIVSNRSEYTMRHDHLNNASE